MNRESWDSGVVTFFSPDKLEFRSRDADVAPFLNPLFTDGDRAEGEENLLLFFNSLVVVTAGDRAEEVKFLETNFLIVLPADEEESTIFVEEPVVLVNRGLLTGSILL